MLDGWSLAQLGTLGLLVFFAGFVDALAGGGGIITLPAYLAAGLPPALLLGTNKLSSSIGTLAAASSYHRRLGFSIPRFLPALACALLGSAGGAALTLAIDPAFIRWLIIAALPAVAWAVLSRHELGRTDLSAQMPAQELRQRTCLLSGGVGAYDGFFGPGTGTFFALGLARWCRYDLLAATGRAKLLNLTTNLAALAIFLWSGRLDPGLGLLMGACSIGGNLLGARAGISRGNRFIRPVVALVCAGLFFKLLLLYR
ncbi:MAG TPA: hypothetical protein DCP85_02715 [Elusimicrobia bacterium]|nr:hypothetical protein [Elusimicrobiota bacterium]